MIGRYGPPLFQILRGLSGAYNVALIKTVPKDGLLKDYLYYLLQEPTIQSVVIAQSQRSAGQTGLQKEFVENLIVPLPPLNEQKHIAAILNEKMEGVEEARKKAIAQLESAKYLPAAYLRAVFNSLEEPLVKLKEVVNIIVPTRDKPKRFCGNIPWVTLPDIDGLFIGSAKNLLTREDAAEVGNRLMPTDTVLLSCAGSLGKVAVTTREVYANQQFYGLVANPNLIEPLFLALSLKNLGEDFFRQIAGVSIVAFFSRDKTLDISIYLPPLLKQKQIVVTFLEKLSEVDKLILTLEEQLKAINQLPATFLRQAFNGEL